MKSCGLLAEPRVTGVQATEWRRAWMADGVAVKGIGRQGDDGDRTAWWNARSARGRCGGRQETVLGGNGERKA